MPPATQQSASAIFREAATVGPTQSPGSTRPQTFVRANTIARSVIPGRLSRNNHAARPARLRADATKKWKIYKIKRALSFFGDFPSDRFAATRKAVLGCLLRSASLAVIASPFNGTPYAWQQHCRGLFQTPIAA